MIKFTQQQSKQIIKEITRVSWAADVSKHPQREIFKFIKVRMYNNNLTIIATNGRILSYSKIEDLEDSPDFTTYIDAKTWRKYKPKKDIIFSFGDMFIYDGETPSMRIFSAIQLEKEYGKYPAVKHIINQPTREVVTLSNSTLKELRKDIKEYPWDKKETKIVTFSIDGHLGVKMNPNDLNVNYDYLWALTKKAPKNAIITIKFDKGMDYCLRPAKIMVDGVYWGTITPIKVSGQ